MKANLYSQLINGAAQDKRKTEADKFGFSEDASIRKQSQFEGIIIWQYKGFVHERREQIYGTANSENGRKADA